jgi:hypothetical protein
MPKNQYSNHFMKLTDEELVTEYNWIAQANSNFQKGGARQAHETSSACEWELETRKIEIPERGLFKKIIKDGKTISSIISDGLDHSFVPALKSEIAKEKN